MARDTAADLAALAAAVPPGVMEVCKRLSEAGFQAFTVGGAVRDTLLRRKVGDWDVTTSAHPDEVKGLFRKVLPTGVEHGTVTVMLGRGSDREAIEVTAFRGEGEYTDGRRPDQVHFGVPLDEDLARRDFVINAIAYDPVAGEIHDSMGGVGDIEARVIRAVGEPERRFAEDGLRIMRAVRFAATLEFTLDAATEAAIPGAIPSLEKVSLERVHVEMTKLLAAPQPSLGLEVALRTGVIACILPELTGRSGKRWAEVFEVIDRAEHDHVVRAALLLAAGDDEAHGKDAAARAGVVCRRLKWSNHDRKRAMRLVEYGPPGQWTGLDDPAIRRRLAALGRDGIADLLVFLAASAAESAPVERIRAIAGRGDALGVGELAVAGRDLIAELGASPGRQLGVVLEALLEEVLDQPSRNERSALLDRARELLANVG